VLKTLEALGPLHGYRIARRVRADQRPSPDAQSGHALSPRCSKLEQIGPSSGPPGASPRAAGRVKIYSLTKSGVASNCASRKPAWQRATGDCRPLFKIAEARVMRRGARLRRAAARAAARTASSIRDLRDEIAGHLAEAADEYERQGQTPAGGPGLAALRPLRRRAANPGKPTATARLVPLESISCGGTCAMRARRAAPASPGFQP